MIVVIAQSIHPSFASADGAWPWILMPMRRGSLWTPPWFNNLNWMKTWSRCLPIDKLTLVVHHRGASV